MQTPFDEEGHQKLHEELMERVRPLFAEQPPAVVGSVLAELVATWLADHPSELTRERLLHLHLGTVEEFLSAMREGGERVQ